jgi:hypothetical protein
MRGHTPGPDSLDTMRSSVTFLNKGEEVGSRATIRVSGHFAFKIRDAA